MIIPRPQPRDLATGHGRGYAVKLALAFAAIYLVGLSAQEPVRTSL
jgi:hypothetical protein